jgi:competence protein ComEC
MSLLLLQIFLGFVVGIVVRVGQAEGVLNWQLLLLAPLVLCCTYVYDLKKSSSYFWRFWLLLLVAVVGYGLCNLAWQRADILRAVQGENITLTGTIDVATVNKSSGGISLELETEGMAHGGVTQNSQGRVRVFMKNAREKFPGEKYYGRIQVTGVLKPLRGFCSPGCPDQEFRSRLKNIGGRMLVDGRDVKFLPGSVGVLNKIARAVNCIRSKTLARVPPREGALLLNMALGGYKNLDEETANIFRTNGMAHLLAVSGTHITFLVSVLIMLTRTWPSLWQNIFVSLSLLGYVCLCGLQPAAVRAGFFCLAQLAGRVKGRSPHQGRILLGIALILLIVNPLWLLEISFQLSFVTVAGLIFLHSLVKKYLPAFLPVVLADLIAVTLTAQLVSLPIAVWYFHQFSLISIVSNLVILPTLVVAVLFFLPLLPLMILLPDVAQFLANGPIGLARGALEAGAMLGKIPGAVKTSGHWGWLRTGAYYLLLISFLQPAWIEKLSLKRKQILLGVGFVIFTGLGFWQWLGPTSLNAYFIDVGQGDAAVVVTPAKQAFLIDAGGLPGERDVGSLVVVPCLRYLGIEELEGIFISHGDYDHVGGAKAVAKAIPVKNVFMGCGAYNNTEQRFVASLPKITQIHRVQEGQNLQFGKLRIEILGGGLPYNNEEFDSGIISRNGNSLVMKLIWDEQKILFTGDADAEAETQTCQQDLGAQLLKVSHHGSPTSSCEAFLKKVGPKMATISAGQDNKYGHPAPCVLERLQNVGAQTLQTKELGTLKVVFDGSTLKWYSYKYQKHAF